MSKAKLMALEDLHSLTALELTNIIRKGVPVVTPQGDPVMDPNDPDEILRLPAPAAYFSSAIKFLKDNDISAEPVPDSPMAGLIESLPTFNDDESEDIPLRRN